MTKQISITLAATALAFGLCSCGYQAEAQYPYSSYSQSYPYTLWTPYQSGQGTPESLYPSAGVQSYSPMPSTTAGTPYSPYATGFPGPGVSPYAFQHR